MPHLVQVAAEKVAAKEFELPYLVKVAAKVAAMEGELPYLVLVAAEKVAAKECELQHFCEGRCREARCQGA